MGEGAGNHLSDAVPPLGADGRRPTSEAKEANVCAGYWRNPEKAAAEFRPDGFISGRGKDLIIDLYGAG